MITPKDIEKQQFEVAFRGYSSREVDEFLNRVAGELAEMIATEELLRKKVAAAELIAKDAKDHEEEFVASMEADRAEATSILESARAEGEKKLPPRKPRPPKGEGKQPQQPRPEKKAAAEGGETGEAKKPRRPHHRGGRRRHKSGGAGGAAPKSE